MALSEEDLRRLDEAISTQLNSNGHDSSEDKSRVTEQCISSTLHTQALSSSSGAGSKHCLTVPFATEARIAQTILPTASIIGNTAQSNTQKGQVRMHSPQLAPTQARSGQVRVNAFSTTQQVVFQQPAGNPQPLPTAQITEMMHTCGSNERLTAPCHAIPAAPAAPIRTVTSGSLCSSSSSSSTVSNYTGNNSSNNGGTSGGGTGASFDTIEMSADVLAAIEAMEAAALVMMNQQQPEQQQLSPPKAQTRQHQVPEQQVSCLPHQPQEYAVQQQVPQQSPQLLQAGALRRATTYGGEALASGIVSALTAPPMKDSMVLCLRLVALDTTGDPVRRVKAVRAFQQPGGAVTAQQRNALEGIVTVELHEDW